jgi:hypothetical protein
VPHPLEKGTLLRVALPGGLTTVACVVQTTAEPPEEWLVGCQFIEELSEEKLALCGAKPAVGNAGNQRGHTRYQTSLEALIRPVWAAQSTYALAKILNLSASGIALLTDR